MNNGDLLYRIINYDDVWVCSIIIFEEGIRFDGPYRYVKEYQFVYRWFSLCIFSGTKYMVIKDFRLFCNLTPDISHVYMDNDFILFYSERKNNSKEDCWSLFDISWSDHYLFFIKPH